MKERIIVYLQTYFSTYNNIPTKKYLTNDPEKPCGYTTIRRLFGSWNNALKEAGIPELPTRKPSIIKPCLQCGKTTKNPKFCSQSCANSYNNKTYPKRKKSKTCIHCNTLIYTTQETCTLCTKKQRRESSISNLTLSEATYTKAQHSNRYRRIRDHARAKHKADILSCQNCGYDKHIEVCHIKPISSFSLDTKISKINDKTNILILCPNCHWEFDNGLLKI